MALFLSGSIAVIDTSAVSQNVGSHCVPQGWSPRQEGCGAHEQSRTEDCVRNRKSASLFRSYVRAAS